MFQGESARILVEEASFIQFEDQMRNRVPVAPDGNRELRCIHFAVYQQRIDDLRLATTQARFP